jgi:Lrp/AsnC family leucine-responsive transcriptional regulator
MTKIDSLDSKDYKILDQLFTNSRQSISQISKKIGNNKGFVKYRLKKMIDIGLIKNFTTDINFFKIGYSVYRLYINLQFTSPAKNKEIIEYFYKYNNTLSIMLLKGNYNLIVTILDDKQDSFYKFYEEIFDKFSNYIRNISVSQLFESFHYDNSFNINKKRINEKISCLDKNIILSLRENSRVSTIQITQLLNISVPTARTHIDNLIKQGIIQRFSVNIDTKKIGYERFIINIYFKNYQILTKFINHIRNNPFIQEINKVIGNYNLEIILLTTSFEHLYVIVEDIEKKFSNDIIIYDYHHITDINLSYPKLNIKK